MKKRRLFRISALLISLVLTLPLISGCSETKSTDSRGRMNSAAISDKASPEWYSEKNSAVRPFGRGADYNRLNAKYQETGQRDKELTTVYEHIPGTLESFVEGKTPDRYTSLVVRGRIVGFDYHVIREYTNGEADNTEYIVTDYYVDLIETLRGVAETDGNGLIKVRVFGGVKQTLPLQSISIITSRWETSTCLCCAFPMRPAVPPLRKRAATV